MLIKNEIPIDAEATNAFISKQLVPKINDPNLLIVPSTVMARSDEEKLIEKYFEVQKDTKEHEQMEVIDLDDDEVPHFNEPPLAHKTYIGCRKREHNNSTSSERESLLKTLPGILAVPQPSLLKPFNQRMSNDFMSVDVKPNVNNPIKTLGDLYKKKKEETLVQQKVGHDLTTVDVKPNIIKPMKTMGDMYQQKTEEKEKEIELPVSTNVKMSRLNLRQALKRAQAAVRGPTNVATPTPAPLPTPPLPPPPPPQLPENPPSSSYTAVTEVATKKSNSNKTRIARGTAAASAVASVASSSGSRKSPVVSSSSEEGTPERGHTPPHNYWPDELEETRTKADEYGQEHFLGFFDLFRKELYAQMQQRRSKRRRRCVQNNNYHYGRIEVSLNGDFVMQSFISSQKF